MLERNHEILCCLTTPSLSGSISSDESTSDGPHFGIPIKVFDANSITGYRIGEIVAAPAASVKRGRSLDAEEARTRSTKPPSPRARLSTYRWHDRSYSYPPLDVGRYVDTPHGGLASTIRGISPKNPTHFCPRTFHHALLTTHFSPPAHFSHPRNLRPSRIHYSVENVHS